MEDKIEELLKEIDEIAMSFDQYAFGLPLHDVSDRPTKEVQYIHR